MMRFLQVLKLEVDPQLKKRLATESLFICASHPTLIDVVILHSLIENAIASSRQHCANRLP